MHHVVFCLAVAYATGFVNRVFHAKLGLGLTVSAALIISNPHNYDVPNPWYYSKVDIFCHRRTLILYDDGVGMGYVGKGSFHSFFERFTPHHCVSHVLEQHNNNNTVLWEDRKF